MKLKAQLTEYMARANESREQRDHRLNIKVVAREHHGRLIADFEKAKDYYATARGLASEVRGREPEFTDKEKINLQIYAERQEDQKDREKLLSLASEPRDSPSYEAALTQRR